MATNSRIYGTIKCPVCNAADIPLEPKEGNPLRVVARHACMGQPIRTVLEKDAPEFPPAMLIDRIEQTEHTEESAALLSKKQAQSVPKDGTSPKKIRGKHDRS
jgi:hypothetical protein